MLFCFCGGLELFGIVAVFGWIWRKVRKLRKKHDTGECCELEHAKPNKDEKLGVCACCAADMYADDVYDDDLDRLSIGREVECVACQEGD
jgi:hypothetical protein